jgi:hypothetical protein
MRLPRSEIEIYYDVDRGALPASGVSGVGPGSVLNRDYTQGVVIEASWELAVEALDNERSALREAAAAARDGVELEDLLFEEPSYFGLDHAAPLRPADPQNAAKCRGSDAPVMHGQCGRDRRRHVVLPTLSTPSSCPTTSALDTIT